MKGGLLGALVFKAISFIGALIVIAMIFVAIIGPGPTRSLGHTTAEVGSVATDIVVTDMIPTFFGGISSADEKAAEKKDEG